MKLTPFDSLGYCESIYVPILQIHKIGKKHHFKDNRNTIFNLFWSLACEQEMERNENIWL